jgi:hypothetical protein
VRLPVLLLSLRQIGEARKTERRTTKDETQVPRGLEITDDSQGSLSMMRTKAVQKFGKLGYGKRTVWAGANSNVH